jgi:hypothetical protein
MIALARWLQCSPAHPAGQHAPASPAAYPNRSPGALPLPGPGRQGPVHRGADGPRRRSRACRVRLTRAAARKRRPACSGDTSRLVRSARNPTFINQKTLSHQPDPCRLKPGGLLQHLSESHDISLHTDIHRVLPGMPRKTIQGSPDRCVPSFHSNGLYCMSNTVAPTIHEAAPLSIFPASLAHLTCPPCRYLCGCRASISVRIFCASRPWRSGERNQAHSSGGIPCARLSHS